jgi:hypothetical protein
MSSYDDQLARVHDAHVEARLDGVEQKRRWMASRTTSLPRNENDRLLMPPLKFTRGTPPAICLVASMKLIAYSLCSSSPVAMAMDVRIEDDVVRIEIEPLGQQLVGARADVTLRWMVSAWPVSSNAITTTPRRTAGRAAPFSGSPLSPSFRLMEFTTGFALDALQPGLEHAPFRAVNHDRQPRNFRLGGDEVQEMRHRLLGIQQGPRPC